MLAVLPPAPYLKLYIHKIRRPQSQRLGLGEGCAQSGYVAHLPAHPRLTLAIEVQVGTRHVQGGT